MFLVSFCHYYLFSLSYIIQLSPLHAPLMLISEGSESSNFSLHLFFFFRTPCVWEDTEVEESDGETASYFYQWKTIDLIDNNTTINFILSSQFPWSLHNTT